MSASEKLKALATQRPGEGPFFYHTLLPQIVAVVEGLEDIVGKWPRGSYEIEQARDYLSALEKSLS